MVQTLPVVLVATATLGAVSTFAAPVIESTPYDRQAMMPVTAREAGSQDLAARELEARQFGLQGIFGALTKGVSRGPGATKLVKGQAKNDIKHGGPSHGKVVGMALPASFATRDLDLEELVARELEARQFGLQSIFGALTKGVSRGPGATKLVKGQAKNDIKNGGPSHGKVVGMALPASFATRDLDLEELSARELEARQFGLQSIFGALTKGVSRGPGATKLVKGQAKNDIKNGVPSHGKVVGMALPASFATRELDLEEFAARALEDRDFEDSYEMMGREYDDGAMTYAREYILDELD